MKKARIEMNKNIDLFRLWYELKSQDAVLAKVQRSTIDVAIGGLK
jgi:hypothetical protein